MFSSKLPFRPQISFTSFLLLLLAILGCSRHSGFSLNNADTSFLEHAASDGIAEVRLGQLAQERGNSVAVKDFGSQMVADHTDAHNKLQIATRQADMVLPAELSAEDRSLYSKLSNLSGIAFDQAYATAMVNDHETDVADFEKEADQGKVKQLKQFAADTLPVLKDHLERARQLQRNVLSADNL